MRSRASAGAERGWSGRRAVWVQGGALLAQKRGVAASHCGALMQVRVFSLCFSSDLGGFDDRALVAFCAAHRITEVAHHVVQVDGEPWLLVLVTWRGESLATSSEAIRRSRGEDVAVAAAIA